MALDASDLVESLMDEQARVNAAWDAGDVNNLVADVVGITGEGMGMTEALVQSATHPPHKWSDGQSAFGFFSWA